MKKISWTGTALLMALSVALLAHDEGEVGGGVSGNPNTTAAACVNGSAGGFPCNKIDIHSVFSFNDFSSKPVSANDVWGFWDLNTEREYAIIGLSNGVAVVDVSDMNQPVEIGTIPLQSSSWRDIKVYQYFDDISNRFRAYAYVTTDNATAKLVVVDLSDLPYSIALANVTTPETSAHNVLISNVDYTTNMAIDGLEPVLYTAGANLSGGRPRAYSLALPDAPAFMMASAQGAYAHDVGSVIIRDARVAQCPNGAAHCVLLADANEGELLIWDITDAMDPRLLNTTQYAGVGYVHSAWFTRDGQHLIVQDELDELDFGHNTQLRVFDMSTLGQPVLAGQWTGSAAAIDHNGFVRGNRYYLSNYTRGITILDITDPTQLTDVGFVDTFVSSDAPIFNGAWGVYPFMHTGKFLVSDINSGLFVLHDHTIHVAEGSLKIAPAVGGDEGSSVQVAVSRDDGTSGAISVRWETQPASADANDYLSASGVLNWADGDDTDKFITVDLAADAIAEDRERFFVHLIDTTGGVALSTADIASVFVSDPATASAVAIGNSNVQTNERGQVALVIVERTGSATGAVSVEYQTQDISATDGQDYTGMASGQLDWTDGDGRAKIIEIPMIVDNDTEGAETFSLSLFNATGATLGTSAATVNIQNVVNNPPATNAGPDRNVVQGAIVTLNGANTADPEGDTLSYQWAQTQGAAVALSGATQAQTSFVAPTVTTTTTYSFMLTATDEFGASASDTISVTVTQSGGGSGGGSIGWLLLVVMVVGATRRRHLPMQKLEKI